MSQLDVGKARGHLKGSIEIEPTAWPWAELQMGCEIVWPWPRRPGGGMLPRRSGAPLDPMFGGLIESTALQESSKAIEHTVGHRQVGVRSSILTVLRNRTVAGLVEK